MLKNKGGVLKSGSKWKKVDYLVVKIVVEDALSIISLSFWYLRDIATQIKCIGLRFAV